MENLQCTIGELSVHVPEHVPEHVPATPIKFQQEKKAAEAITVHFAKK